MSDSNLKPQPGYRPSGVLFVSLGTSPAVVPEAFLFPEVDFTAVHVLTTAKPDVSLIQLFFAEHFPNARLSISRVEGFDDFESQNDHNRFEEILYRWILQGKVPADRRWFCLSGGYKTMSASVQKAANLFGAAGVFHVLSAQSIYPNEDKPRNPASISEILSAKAEGKLHWISLGSQNGWPQMRYLHAEDYPLVHLKDEGVDWLSAAGDALRQDIQEIENRIHSISSSWERLIELPFNEIASWPEQDLAWLNEPLQCDTEVDKRWIESLPKVELHCHLGGFATQGNLLVEVENASRKATSIKPRNGISLPHGWPLPDKPVGLESYRKLGDDNGSRLLCDPDCLRKQCHLLYQHFLEHNVCYAEVRCSPANYADVSVGRSPWDVLSDIQKTFQSCMDRQLETSKPKACHVNLIIIGTRQAGGDFRAGISRHLALAVTAAGHWIKPGTCRVVGVDLAGFEDPSTRAHYFREEFTAVHRCGLALTVHAGENDDAEGIWRAVFDLNARRLGHALSLADSPELIQSVSNRGIGIEMCPYANYQIKGFLLDGHESNDSDSKHYPLLKYLRQGLKATVNTDNIGISAAGLNENLLLIPRLCPGITRMDMLRLLRNAIDVSFENSVSRQQLLAKVNTLLPLPGL
jgi:adenosine deaminase